MKKYLDKQLTKNFFSNCLFEALKAKIKDFKNVKIIFIPKKYNEWHSLAFHCFWLKDNVIYDFKSEKHLNHIWQVFLFKGHIRANDKSFYERIMKERVDAYCRRLSKQLGAKLYFKDKFTEEAEQAEIKNPENSWFNINEIPTILEGEEVEVIYKNNSGKRCITYSIVKDSKVDIGKNKTPLFVRWALFDPNEGDEC